MPTTSTDRLPLAVCVVGAIAFAAALIALPAYATEGARVTADEPQYLLSALSLFEDRDLDISDEIAARRYVAFHAIDLDPQTISLDEQGRQISPHDPLLPVILAAPMGIGGWVGAKIAMAAMAGLLAALTLWTAARRFDVDVAVGAVVVGVFAVTPPLVSYGSLVYPEVPAAIAVVVGLAALTGALRFRGLALLATALVVLPWLSIKYAPVALVLAAIAGVQLWRRGQRGDLALMAVVGVVAGLVFLVFHHRVYGGWTAYASGDHFVDDEFGVVGSVDPVGRSRRLIGLMVDRGFGLVAWNPAALAFAPAVGALFARRPRGWLTLLLPVVAGWATATWVALTMHGWWWPGRQIVVVVPLLVIAVAHGIHSSRRLLVPFVVAAVVACVGWVWLSVEAMTGRRTLIVSFEDTTFPWYRVWRAVLPDFRSPDVADVLLGAGWALLLIALAVVAYVRVRRAPTMKNANTAGSEPSLRHR